MSCWKIDFYFHFTWLCSVWFIICCVNSFIYQFNFCFSVFKGILWLVVSLMASGKTDFLVLLPVSIQVIIQIDERVFAHLLSCLVLSPVSLSVSAKVDERVFAHLLSCLVSSQRSGCRPVWRLTRECLLTCCLVMFPVSVQAVGQCEGWRESVCSSAGQDLAHQLLAADLLPSPLPRACSQWWGRSWGWWVFTWGCSGACVHLPLGCVQVSVCACVLVCMDTLRIVSVDKILCFTNTSSFLTCGRLSCVCSYIAQGDWMTLFWVKFLALFLQHYFAK